MRKVWGVVAAGLCCGIVNGLFGAGGGMILVPLLTALTDIDESHLFPASISIILPICLVSLGILALEGQVSIAPALPYLITGGMGGFLAGKWGHKIPLVWLHRILGIFIAWGGLRYLC